MDIHDKRWRKFLTEKRYADYDVVPGSWTEIPASDIRIDPAAGGKDIAHELHAILAKSYEYTDLGHHVDFKTPGDLPADSDYWTATDVDGDQEPDATWGGKKKPHGTKLTAGGADGSMEGKAAYLDKTYELLSSQGNYSEMSDALAHIMIKYRNVPFVDNQQDVEKVLGKKVEWVGEHRDPETNDPTGKYPNHNGWYICKIGGRSFLKILLGTPNI